MNKNKPSSPIDLLPELYGNESIMLHLRYYWDYPSTSIRQSTASQYTYTTGYANKTNSIPSYTFKKGDTVILKNNNYSHHSIKMGDKFLVDNICPITGWTFPLGELYIHNTNLGFKVLLVDLYGIKTVYHDDFELEAIVPGVFPFLTDAEMDICLSGIQPNTNKDNGLPKCTCVNLWIGCKCGAFKAEMEAKNNKHK